MTVPATPPPKHPDRHYDFRGMNVVFAASALALLAVTLWMVFADYAKPWKRLQAQFRDLERQAVLGEMEAERQRINEQEIQALEGEIAAEQQKLAERRDEIARLEERLKRAKDDVYRFDAASRTTKSRLDAAKYEYDEALQGGDPDEIAAEEKRVEELRQRWNQERLDLERAEKDRDEALAALEAERSGVAESEQKLAALRQGLVAQEQRAATLSKDIDYFLLNAPLLDFLDPSLKIEQVILPGLYHDINFTNIDRVDRCMTCHVVANRPGYDDAERWPQPFRSHPRLDLFLADSSPHPYSRFGCTICHAGLDRATDFARAGHTPVSEEQRQEWIDQWGWERQYYLDYPILPANLSEAGCQSCHAGDVWIPQSQVLDVGRELIHKMGCYGCHQIDYPAFSDLRRPGPDLTKIAAKTTREWAAKWIEAPREFRPTTWMPHFFFLENIGGEVNPKRQQAEIAGIVEYLWARSGTASYPPPPAGDPEAGRLLFEAVGCTGCHILDADARRDQYFPQINRLHGPNLVRTGSKVSAGWLFAWLKDPKQYWHDTNMPSLRLSDREAADLTAYLMASRDPDFEGLALPQVDGAVRDDLVVAYLRSNLTYEQSQARLAAMSDPERDAYLGEQAIRKYGCFGCHNIEGFEDAKPIGVELSEEGAKPLHLFDFGHIHDIPHTRADWIRTKLLRPRIWDQGKELVKEYDELYKMPDFGMSRQEADAVLANVLAFTKENVIASRKAALSSRSAALAAGRKLMTRYNCQGCHLIEGEGHAIRTAIEDVGMLPPNLAAEGARVQAGWLFGYLHDPGQVTLRPWLSVRMPTFGFDDLEKNTVVGYFAARDERGPFLTEPPPPETTSRAVGEEVFGMLQCARCHPAGEEAVIGAAPGELAPSLLLAQKRLRHDWIAPWIEDPQGFIPGTKMPTNFPLDSATGRADSRILVGAIDTPRFAEQKRRMLRYFASEAELKAYLADVDKVTGALRDYVWTLEQ